MNTQQLYKIIDLTNIIALATYVDNVNFCYDLNRPGILYFATDRTNPKVKEMITNPHISFTTIPLEENTIPHARSNQSIVKKVRKP